MMLVVDASYYQDIIASCEVKGFGTTDLKPMLLERSEQQKDRYLLNSRNF